MKAQPYKCSLDENIQAAIKAVTTALPAVGVLSGISVTANFFLNFQGTLLRETREAESRMRHEIRDAESRCTNETRESTKAIRGDLDDLREDMKKIVESLNFVHKKTNVNWILSTAPVQSMVPLVPGISLSEAFNIILDSAPPSVDRSADFIMITSNRKIICSEDKDSTLSLADVSGSIDVEIVPGL